MHKGACFLLPQGRTGGAVFLSMLFGATAWAQQEIELQSNFSKVLKSDRPIVTAIVGNPNIAEITNQGDRALVLTGKSPGATNLILLDSENNEFFHVRVTVLGPGPIPNRVLMHSKGRSDLHHYWAYTCAPGEQCERLEDKLEDAGRSGSQSESRFTSETTTKTPDGESTSRGETRTFRDVQPPQQ